MKDSKHTPLPWVINKCHLVGNATKEVANLYGGNDQIVSSEEMSANAQLIVTSVNNFEEMKDIVEHYYDHLKQQDKAIGLNLYSDNMKSKIHTLLQKINKK